MKTFKVVILGVVAAAIAAGIIAQWRTRGRLVSELSELRKQDRQNASQRVQVDQIAVAKNERQPRQGQNTEAAHRRDDAAFPREESLSTSGLVRPEHWKNAGRGTPAAAFETLEWALDRGEIDTLAASFTFAPDVRRKLDELFANLSDEVRLKYKTPESLIALLVSGNSKGPQAFQVMGETFQGPDIATIRVRIQQADGRVEDSDEPLRREGDGWKLLVSEQEALEKMTKFFPEATWKTIEGKKR